MDVRITTRIVEGPILLEESRGDGSSGASCIFRGRVRSEEHPEHGDLLALAYEAYEPMAGRMLQELAEEVSEEFGLHALVILHATGRIEIGCTSVLVEAEAPHRDAAFTGARAAIDRLKQRLPIFKTELWREGTTRPTGMTPCAGTGA